MKNNVILKLENCSLPGYGSDDCDKIKESSLDFVTTSLDIMPG